MIEFCNMLVKGVKKELRRLKKCGLVTNVMLFSWKKHECFVPGYQPYLVKRRRIFPRNFKESRNNKQAAGAIIPLPRLG